MDTANEQRPGFSRENLKRQIAGARYALLLILVFTVLNLVLLVLDAGRYFLFSASVPYYLIFLGLGLDNGFSPLRWNSVGSFTVTGLIISGVILGVYLVFLLLSTKKPGFLWGALGLFVLDTLALIFFSFTLYENPSANLMDGFLHLWAIVELGKGIRANGILKKLPPEQPADLSRIQNILSGISHEER